MFVQNDISHWSAPQNTRVAVFIDENFFSGLSQSGAHGVMVIVGGNEYGNTSSILGETDCISHSTNTFGKDMNPIILFPVMGK